MDLSVNKLGKNHSIKFKGLKSGYTPQNAPVYKFYPPAYDKTKEIATLEFTEISVDKSNGKYISPQNSDFESIEFENDKPLEFYQEELQHDMSAFAYRYKITDKDGKNPRYIIDNFNKIDVTKGHPANLIEQGSNYGITPKMGPMRHSFIDSDVVLDKRLNMVHQNKDFVRNHFNKLGGSLKGLTYLLTKTDELDPYRYIMSTPVIAEDKLSSHGYWPFNQYQCDNLEDFKEFIFELYKRGKGYVADGAFTSQGLSSPMVQHVLKWGKESPFYNMMKFDPSSTITLGILPDRSNVEGVGDYDYIGVKVVNNPNRDDYDHNKPVYIQFFDTRLVQDETRDKNELIEQYDKLPDDHYDITNHQDSVTPYHFEISPSDTKRLNLFKNQDSILLGDVEDKSDFLTFKNYSIGSKNNAAGANFWDGNRDIIKMNLSNPNTLPGNREGFFAARDYLLGVATYWSELVQSDLILKTALLSEDKKAEVAKNNDIDNYDEIKNSLNRAESLVLKQNKQVEDYVREFPVQSIETYPDLSAIFAQPDFQKEFFDDMTVNKISGIVQDAIDRIIPEQYKDNEDYRAYITKVYANTLIRNLLIGAMCPKALDENGNTNLEQLKTVSLHSLGGNKAQNVEAERKTVENKLKYGINPETLENTIQTLSNEAELISLDDFKLSESIVLQGKAGLNWRFDASKDIGDLDAVRDRKESFQNIWYGKDHTPGVQDFWINFVKNIKSSNPSAYIIAEVTSIGDFSNNFANFHEQFERQTNDKDAQASLLEKDFINKTGATTVSNYSHYFNQISEFIGVNPEYGSGVDNKAGNVGVLKDRTDALLSDYQPNTALLSHVFIDNHDKPRVLHTMPIKMDLFMAENLENADTDTRNRIAGLTLRADFKNISGSAAAVGLAFDDVIQRRYKDKPEEKAKLERQLGLLINGQKNPDSPYNYRRADAFGKLPYEVTIRDLFKGAGINNEEEMLDFRFDLLKDSIEYETKLWEVIHSLIGTPTLFNGTEFFQTGYETPSHNFYVANRNQTLHELKNDKRFGKYYERMQSIASLYQKPDLSAIRNGFPVSGNLGKEGDLEFYPLYRYDEKGSKVISLITDNGIPKNQRVNECHDTQNKTHTLNSIKLDFDGKEVLEDKMPLKRIYLQDDKYVVDDNEYVLEKHNVNGKVTYEIKNKNGGNIRLQGTVETFYFPKSELNGKKATMRA